MRTRLHLLLLALGTGFFGTSQIRLDASKQDGPRAPAARQQGKENGYGQNNKAR